MFDKLRDQMAAELKGSRVGVLTAAGELGPLSAPVRYRVLGLEVECLLPSWSDLAYTLESAAPVLLVVLAAPDGAQRWIRYQGTARTLPEAAGLAPGLVAVRISPTRIDLIDETRGWGARETLDLQ